MQEKLDGSCVAVARIDNEILALGREGKLASASPNAGRQLFAKWVKDNQERFLACLQPGEHFVGEWLALAHGTRYQLTHEPWVAFDLLRGKERMGVDELSQRVAPGAFVTPYIVHRGAPIRCEDAMAALGHGGHGAEQPEGAIWRVERDTDSRARVVLIAKFVRGDKRDGNLLPENSGRAAVWNWQPE